MQYTNAQLKELWSNAEKRHDFIKRYKEWGVFLPVPELGLTFYQYELSDGCRLIVMEHMIKNLYPRNGELEWGKSVKTYLQKGEYFVPNPVSGYEVEEHLKELKKKL